MLCKVLNAGVLANYKPFRIMQSGITFGMLFKKQKKSCLNAGENAADNFADIGEMWMNSEILES